MHIGFQCEKASSLIPSLQEVGLIILLLDFSSRRIHRLAFFPMVEKWSGNGTEHVHLKHVAIITTVCISHTMVTHPRPVLKDHASHSPSSGEQSFHVTRHTVRRPPDGKQGQTGGRGFIQASVERISRGNKLFLLDKE